MITSINNTQKIAPMINGHAEAFIAAAIVAVAAVLL